jgi:dihydrofolate reductase
MTNTMRKIITTTYVTLDGVMQAPGGPEEDTSGGFKYGGWLVNYWDEITGDVLNKFMGLPFELLLGKRTYDIFAAYWPHAKTDHTVAKPFNSTKKYVVSHEPAELSWNNSTLIIGDVVAEIRKLKKRMALICGCTAVAILSRHSLQTISLTPCTCGRFLLP